MTSLLRTSLSVLFAGCLAAGLSACEEDVVGVLGTDQAFSLYGVLDPRADTQFVRVYPIRPRLEPADPAPLDARFVSTDLTTGATRVWAETLMVDPGGDVGHFFWSDLRVAHSHSYRLAIEGSDGRSSQAEVHVPGPAHVVVDEPRYGYIIILPVRIVGDVPRLMRLEAVFYVAYAIGFSDTGIPILEFVEIPISLEGSQRRTAAGWTVLVNLSDAYDRIFPQLSGRPFYASSYGVALGRITLRAVAANEAWAPPGDRFDPEVLVEPSVMTNVENGFGFVGAGYRIEHQWVPADSVVARSGFRPIH